jgi:hypothetical protein
MIALLLALYPARWRRRYGEEFRAMLESRPLGPFDVVDILLGALDARVTRFRLVGDLGAEGGHVMTLRIGGLSAILGGILWFAGLAGSSAGLEPMLPWRAVGILGSLGILLALAALSAFQAHREPRLAWAAFGIPAVGLLLSIAGLVAWVLVPEDSPIVGSFTAWSIWAIGLLTLLVGSILFAIATLRAEVLSSRAALAMAASACLTILVAFGSSGVDEPTAVGRLLSALVIGSFAGSWVALGLTALRRGPIRAITLA